MSSYAIKVDLKKLQHTGLVNVKGRKCVLISVDDNAEIFVGEKGIYLNITAIEMKQASQFGDTHFLKGNRDKEAFEKLTEEERKALPIIGNMRPLERRVAEQPAVPIADADLTSAEDDGDLPF